MNATPRSSKSTTNAPVLLKRPRRRQVNPPTKYRVVFAGPVGAGKTTAVRALSDVDAVDTDVAISIGSREHGDGDKTTTTVGLDYGVWKPTTEISVVLVGTPGQERFTAARNAVTMPHTRVILWLRADRPDMASDAEEWLHKFAGGVHRVAIAVTRADIVDESPLTTLSEVLTRHGVPSDRVHEIDARERDSVMRVVCEALDFPEERLA